MPKFKPQHTRLLFIDQKIREKGYPSTKQLATEWEVSYKTIQRDIEYMRYQLDAPIKYSAKKRGLYYSEDSFNLPAFSVKESDLFAVYLAQQLLVQYEGTPLYDNLFSVYKKIEQALPGTVAVDADIVHSRVTVFPSACTPVDPVVWKIVFSSLRNLKSLRISYRTPGKAVQERELDIYHMVRFEENWYVIGYCHLRKQVRTFHLSRIEKAVSIDKEYVIPEDFNFLKLTGSHFGLYWTGNEQAVRIKFFKPVVPYILERTWHKSQQIEKNLDGSIILSLKVNHLLELRRWVLSWGGNAEVLEPKQLVDDIKSDLTMMTSNYG